MSALIMMMMITNVGRRSWELWLSSEAVWSIASVCSNHCHRHCLFLPRALKPEHTKDSVFSMSTAHHTNLKRSRHWFPNKSQGCSDREREKCQRTVGVAVPVLLRYKMFYNMILMFSINKSTSISRKLFLSFSMIFQQPHIELPRECYFQRQQASSIRTGRGQR